MCEPRDVRCEPHPRRGSSVQCQNGQFRLLLQIVRLEDTLSGCVQVLSDNAGLCVVVLLDVGIRQR